MAKTKADDLPKLYIWQLARAGLFANPGLIAEIRYKDDIISYILPSVRYKDYIQITYPSSVITQSVKLTTTTCHIAGTRRWFECPYCRRRCGTLFLCGLGYFACRLCLDLSYESKNKNYRKKDYDFLKKFDNFFKAGELNDQLKRFSYAGKPTRKMKKIENLYKNSIYF